MTQKRILILEDEIVIQRLCERLLAKTGHELLFARTLKTAFEAIEKKDLDLFISDLKLPDGNGVEAIRRFKEKYPNKRVIIMTGSLSPENRMRAIEDLNISLFLYKPFDNIDFEATVQIGLAG